MTLRFYSAAMERVSLKAGIAFFDMVNAEGGVNGRKIKIVSLYDGYAPSYLKQALSYVPCQISRPPSDGA